MSCHIELVVQGKRKAVLDIILRNTLWPAPKIFSLCFSFHAVKDTDGRPRPETVDIIVPLSSRLWPFIQPLLWQSAALSARLSNNRRLQFPRRHPGCDYPCLSV
jgi:hypothetical protein